MAREMKHTAVLDKVEMLSTSYNRCRAVSSPLTSFSKSESGALDDQYRAGRFKAQARNQESPTKQKSETHKSKRHQKNTLQE